MMSRLFFLCYSQYMIYSGKLLKAIKTSQRREPASGIMTAITHGFGRKGLIPLWAGEGHLPTPQFICDATAASLQRGETFYTWQKGIPELRQALADYHARLYDRPYSSKNFFVTGGGMQAMQTAMQMLIAKGDEVIVPTPAWPNYAGPLRMMEAKPLAVPLSFNDNHWTLDLDRLFAATGNSARAICINSPSNPVGWVASLDELQAILDFSRKTGIWIIADEVYSRFYHEGSHAPSFQQIYHHDDRLIFVNTFSKNWAMTGWRTGWIQAPAELGDVIENIIQYNTSGTAAFMQRGCIAALEHGEEFLRSQVASARANRDYVAECLSTIDNVQFETPRGAFYHFFKLEGMDDSTATALEIIDKANVGLAPGAAFGEAGEGFLRLCFLRDRSQLETAMERLVNWLQDAHL